MIPTILKWLFYVLAALGALLGILAIVGGAPAVDGIVIIAIALGVFVPLARYFAGREPARAVRLRDAPPRGRGAPSAGPAETGVQTQEFPLTPAMRAAIARHANRQRWWPILLGAVFDVFLLAVAVYVLQTPGGLPYALGIVGLAVLLSVGAYFWYRSIRRTATRDLASGVFRRLTGPVRTGREEKRDSEGSTTTYYYLIYEGRRQSVGRDIYDAVVKNKVSWGTIEDTPIGHLIFSIRDANGQLVYHFAGYDPDALDAG